MQRNDKMCGGYVREAAAAPPHSLAAEDGAALHLDVGDLVDGQPHGSKAEARAPARLAGLVSLGVDAAALLHNLQQGGPSRVWGKGA